jgi:hypothetical protein
MDASEEVVDPRLSVIIQVLARTRLLGDAAVALIAVELLSPDSVALRHRVCRNFNLTRKVHSIKAELSALILTTFMTQDTTWIGLVQ